MAYCRWGPDSDVYCYESDCGFVVHLAGRKLKPDAERYTGPPEGMVEFFCNRPDSDYISLPDFKDENDWAFTDAESCCKFLMKLRRAGFTVPDYAILYLLEEAMEEDGEFL